MLYKPETPVNQTTTIKEDTIKVKTTRARKPKKEVEIEVIKKQMALRHEKWAAQLKAKKQQSSKISGEKDIN